jgi:hypothetical protein
LKAIGEDGMKTMHVELTKKMIKDTSEFEAAKGQYIQMMNSHLRDSMLSRLEGRTTSTSR